MKPKNQNDRNEQVLQDIKQLFESRNGKHKQDRDFFKHFQQIIKKEPKISDKKTLIGELLNQFKQISQNKVIYFNTIIDCLLYLFSKNINVTLQVQDAIKYNCQVDKKSKDIQDFEEIKIFCFQKLDISPATQEYQINEQHKILVFMERIIKYLQGIKTKDENKSSEEYKKIITFLHSLPYLTTQVQIQALLCIIIQRVIINFTQGQISLIYEFKILFNLIDDINIFTCVNSLICIAQTSMQHEYYQYIFKACVLILIKILTKSKISIYSELVISSVKFTQYFFQFFKIYKDYNQLLFYQNKDQSLLFENPKLLLDYLPSNIILDILHFNPSLWLGIQGFIQDISQHSLQISDQYFNFILANLAQRQGKLTSFQQTFKQLITTKIKQTDVASWIKNNTSLILKSQQMEKGDYKSYKYLQVHLLLFLQSINAASLYFKTSTIKTDSNFFKMLILLKLDNQIFKHQEISQLIKTKDGINSYYKLQVNKELQKLVDSNIDLHSLKNVYQTLKRYLNVKYHYQTPFLSKLPSFIQVFCTSIRETEKSKEQDWEHKLQLTFQLTLLLSVYSKQGFHTFIFELFEMAMNNQLQNPLLKDLTNYQLCAIQQVGVMFDNLTIDDSKLQQMINQTFHFFLTTDIQGERNKSLMKLFKKLQVFIRGEGKSIDLTLQTYRHLILMALDKFLVLNGLHSSSIQNRKSKFYTFFDQKLKENTFFVQLLCQICSKIKITEISQNLKCLGMLYLQDLSMNRQNFENKFEIACFTLFNQQGRALHELSKQVKDKGQLQWIQRKKDFIKIFFGGIKVNQKQFQLFIKNYIIMKKHQKNVCWICYSQMSNNHFKPCYCKGSLSYVHKRCLNEWVTKKYGNSFTNTLIQCPNCKYEYVYMIKENYKFKDITKYSFCDSIEKIVLICLTIFQIIMSSYDYVSTKDYIEINNSDLEFQLVNFIHFSTVIIVLFAAGFNIIQMGITKTQIIIQSRS